MTPPPGDPRHPGPDGSGGDAAEDERVREARGALRRLGGELRSTDRSLDGALDVLRRDADAASPDPDPSGSTWAGDTPADAADGDLTGGADEGPDGR